METQLELKTINPQLLDVTEFKSWMEMKIESDDDEKLAGSRLNMIAKRVRELKANRDFVLKPFKDHIKVLDTKAKEASEPLSVVESYLRRTLGAWLHTKRVKEEAAQKKLRDETAAKMKIEADKKALEAASVNDENAFEKASEEVEAAQKFSQTTVAVRPNVRSEQGSVGTMVKWNWKVVDAGAVPREFLILDEKRLNQVAVGYKTKPQTIPGIEFFETTVPVVRSY